MLTRFVKTFLALAGYALSVCAEPQVVRSHEVELAVATARVKQLQRELLDDDHLCMEGPCVQQKVAAVRAILREYTLGALNGDSDSSHLLADLRSITGADIPGSHAVVGRVFRRLCPGGERIVALSVVHYGGSAIAGDAVIIQGFRKDGPQYVFAAEAGEMFWGPVLQDAILLEQSSRPQELWIMAYGRLPGAARNLVKAGIYGFDGYRFEEMWQSPLREDVDFHIRHDQIELDYNERRPREFGFDEMDLIQEILQLTATGVIEGRRTNLGPNAVRK